MSPAFLWLVACVVVVVFWFGLYSIAAAWPVVAIALGVLFVYAIYKAAHELFVEELRDEQRKGRLP